MPTTTCTRLPHLHLLLSCTFPGATVDTVFCFEANPRIASGRKAPRQHDRLPQAQLGKVEVRYNSGVVVLLTSAQPRSMIMNSECRLPALLRLSEDKITLEYVTRDKNCDTAPLTLHLPALGTSETLLALLTPHPRLAVTFRIRMLGAKEFAGGARNRFGTNTPFKAGHPSKKKLKPTETAAWPRMTARAVNYWDSLMAGTNKRAGKAAANGKAHHTGGLGHKGEAFTRMHQSPKKSPRDVHDSEEEYEESFDGDDDEYVAAMQRQDLEDGVPDDVDTELENDDATAGDQLDDLTKRYADDEDSGDDQFYDDRYDSLDEDAMDAYADADDGDDEVLQKRDPSFYLKQKSAHRGGGRGSAAHMHHARDVDDEEEEADDDDDESPIEEDLEYVADIKARNARKEHQIVGTSPPWPTEAPTVTTAKPKTAPAASVTGIKGYHKHGQGRHAKHGGSAKKSRPTGKAARPTGNATRPTGKTTRPTGKATRPSGKATHPTGKPKAYS
ncbi:uncharacterized protein MYCFIDRAFT_192725 [Pseudocercospora fijiensis CIRAD86]|uniref:Nucleoplasmin-like domain-containing protein n=1 Tax=Pseudocercospora fijiensis (strain CIRAD86) TaxID=383855 RepID=N1Q7F6_PSEFD|nr:uncharacterized protein MYCFIDRAFT_192725 [Pseudocercospora fijiensis CIRAD86]EME88594.1 hypothetical protein MYCFIDRAFT_192725 [Pseudocercospora fijiensis CIRAD86]